MSHKWLAFGVVAVGIFMGTMDMSGLIVALPTFGHEFDAPPELVLWLVLAYTLTFTSTMLTAGRLADLAGRKRVYAAGFLVFTAGLALSSTASGLWQLVAYRVLQAIGGAMLISNANAILADVFPEQERGKALGLLESVVGAGLMAGPVVAGFLLDALGWPAIFYVRVPLGILGFVLASRVLREPAAMASRPRFDPIGALTLSAGLLALTAAINQGHRAGWGSPVILALLIGGAAFLVAFLVAETRVQDPVVDLRLFRNRAFSTYNALLVAYFLPSASLPFLLPFFLVQAVGYSASVSGLFFTVVPLLMFLLSPVTGMLADRFGSWAMSATGLALQALGLFLLSRMSLDFSPLYAIGGLVVLGVGAGLFLTPTYSAVMAATPPSYFGTASALIATLRSVGVATGQAVAATVFAVRRDFHENALAGLDPEERFRTSLALGFQDAVLVVAAVALLGLAIALAFGRRPRAPGAPRPLEELAGTRTR